MKYTLLSLGLVAFFSLSACDDGKVFGDGLDEKTLISEIELTNVENGINIGCNCRLYRLFDYL